METDIAVVMPEGTAEEEVWVFIKDSELSACRDSTETTAGTCNEEILIENPASREATSKIPTGKVSNNSR